MTGPEPKTDKTIWVAIGAAIGALISALGFIVVAYVSGQYNVRSQTEPIRMIIEATSTAEANATLAVHMAATITAAANQNLDKVQLSVLLPGGHTTPDPFGNTIPASDKKLAIRMKIPILNVDAPVVQGDGRDELMKGVGQKLGTAFPGENGIIILSAYNDIYGELFRYLDQLQPGDKIILFSAEAEYSYSVERHDFALSQLINLEFDPTKSNLLLTSQYPYLQDNQWIIVFATLDN